MHVIAHHRITDREGFRALAQEPTSARPLHWRLITSAPTRDGAHCFSLWRVDSLEALERFLTGAMGDAGTVACYEVDDDDALGHGDSLAGRRP